MCSASALPLQHALFLLPVAADRALPMFLAASAGFVVIATAPDVSAS